MIPLIFFLSATPVLTSALDFSAPSDFSKEQKSSLVTRGEGFIRSPLNVLPNPAPPKLIRGRQNEVPIENQFTGTRYGIDIEVGTPGQKLTLILDTGSPDTWVNPTCDTANVPDDCRTFPVYDWRKSTSLNATRVTDILVYGKGNATIQYVRESVKLGGATVRNQVIGVALESHDIPLGILGLSPPIRGVNEYPYILDTMKDQKLINSRAFSMDLRTVDSPEGALIFGGVDTGKYVGSLAKLPMLSRNQTPRGADRYYVTMTGVGLTYPDGLVERSQELQVPVFLDSGGTLSRLPRPIYQAFASSFADTQYDPSTGFYFLDCDVADLDGSIDFYFGDKVINVPFNDFIWHVQGYCVLGVLPDDDGEPVLGDTFLRAAYVVFDQDNRNLHLAQAANCGSNIVAISTGTDAVPSVTGRCTAPPPRPTSGNNNLDVTAERGPTATFTGIGPTGIDIGPGPVATRVSGTGPLGINPTGQSGAGSVKIGWWDALVAVLIVGLVM
ncbi:putative eukaryotic aspartyl protease [Triangularia setosa]|uniref:Eukaryotic aspartyl protease n=1 Tax=Triangularia setosa TaxID=2587417 RepID=A0AAN6WAB2_9PEZI|nr:putative eukaryotic aspartyl protease [Podospora setosa]